MMLLVELTQVTAVEFQYRYTICKTLEDALTPFFPGLLLIMVTRRIYFSKLLHAWLCLLLCESSENLVHCYHTWNMLICWMIYKRATISSLNKYKWLSKSQTLISWSEFPVPIFFLVTKEHLLYGLKNFEWLGSSWSLKVKS